MEKWKRRSIDLLTSLAFGVGGEIEVVPYYPQKTEVSRAEMPFFSRTLPEKKGISSKRLYNMLCELENESRANIHSIMVICRGEIICECSAEGYSTNEWHISHSMSKTVCGMVIGILVDEGKIKTDDRLVDIFPEIPYKDKRFPLITVDHLLSMTCGVDFAEAGAITEERWTEIFFSSSLKFTPGTKFFYNSMNSYILARICERVSGRNFLELVNEYIFAPLGIRNYLWEKGPEGTEKGGWGLYLSPESWAKVGYMFLSGGIFRGRRILSSGWVKNSSKVKAIAPKEIGNFNYGYHMWVGRNNREVLFNGMLGQNLWICPQNNILVVIMGGNNELFQDSPALEIIRKYLGGRINDRLWRRNSKLLQEKEAEFFRCRRWIPTSKQKKKMFLGLGLRKRPSFDNRWEDVFGIYRFASNNASVMPLIIRGMQNNFGPSLDRLKISQEAREIWITFFSGEEMCKIPLGSNEYKTVHLDFRGEKYIVRSLGAVCKNQNGETEYRIEILFPETASKRRIKIKKVSDGKITVDFSETPDNKILDEFISKSIEQNSRITFFTNILERRFGKGIISKTLSRIFNPTLIGVDEKNPDMEKIIEEENKRNSEQSGTVKLICAVVDRFFREGYGKRKNEKSDKK